MKAQQSVVKRNKGKQKGEMIKFKVKPSKLKAISKSNSVKKLKKKIKSIGFNKVRNEVKESCSDEERHEEEETVKTSEDENEDIDQLMKEGVKHKQALSKLKDTDPEFFKFLQENDRKLLQFELSESEDETSDEEEEEDELHKPPDKLEVDSEESDFEEDKKSDPTGKAVTLSMIRTWRDNLTTNAGLESISNTVKGFHAALVSVTDGDDSELRVDGSGVFNAVIELCVMHLQPAVVRFLKLNPNNVKNPDKAKRWVKVKSILQSYFTDLLKLLSGVASEHIISVLLKHFHTACPFVACFSKLSRTALKQLTKVWSSCQETVQVLAFLCILKLCTSHKTSLLNSSLKLLYIAYIRSSKFVSVNSLPQINFMRKSLTSLFTIDPVLSYQHAFLYIRQLAIHLRNAVTIHKKENFQSVYNWQYIHSLRLWVDLLCSTKESQEIQQLLYPVVQIIIGCIKLIPTSQYIPLRFHCIQLLVLLSRETGVYTPTLPLILDSLTCVNLNKENKKLSMKPFDFTCILRLSKSAMTENAFQDAVVDNVYKLLLEATASFSHSIAFPDLIVPAVSQLKTFIKDCKMNKYTLKMKQLLGKIEENAKFINSERNKMAVNLSETEKIVAFEKKIQSQGTPLFKFWDQWNKDNVLQTAKQTTKNEKLEEMDLPTIKRKTVKKKEIADDKPVELFPSDDESDSPGFENEEKPDSDNMESSDKEEEESTDEENTESEAESNEMEDQEDIVEELNLKDF